MSSFAALWASSAEAIESSADEVALIAAAQKSNSDATLRLIRAYLPALTRAVSQYTRVLPLEDARQAATVGLIEAVRAFDPASSRRLASILLQHVYKNLGTAAGDATGGFSVPLRSLQRFFGILSAADGDPNAAAKLAPSYAMAEETFWTIYVAVRRQESLEAEMSDNGDALDMAAVAPCEVADADDRMMCSLAFRAVDDVEGDVIRLAYGFADYDPQPDAEVGFRLGFSRLKALRTRQRALGKMRHALGARNDSRF